MEGLDIWTVWGIIGTDPGREDSVAISGTTAIDSAAEVTTGDDTGIDSEIGSITGAEPGSMIIGSEISADTDSRVVLIGTDSGAQAQAKE